VSEKEYSEIYCRVFGSTDKAVGITVSGLSVWIPWQFIEDNGEELKPGYTGNVYIETWIAEERGLV